MGSRRHSSRGAIPPAISIFVSTTISTKRNMMMQTYQ